MESPRHTAAATASLPRMLRYPKEEEGSLGSRFDPQPCVRSVIQLACDAIDLARTGIFGPASSSAAASLPPVVLPPPAAAAAAGSGAAGRSLYRSRREGEEEELTSLVDLAVDGLDKEKKTSKSSTKRPGGATFMKPAAAAARAALASENLKSGAREEDVSRSREQQRQQDSHEDDGTNAAADSQKGRTKSTRSAASDLEVCREEEAKVFRRLEVCLLRPSPSEDATSSSGPTFPSWYLIDGDWWRAWTAFVKGDPSRPGRIRNENLLSEDDPSTLWPGCEPGRSFVGVDHRGWGILAHLYGADCSVLSEDGFPSVESVRSQQQRVRVRFLESE